MDVTIDALVVAFMPGFYYNVFSGGSFSGFTLFGGAANGSPSCFALEAGKVMCVIPNVNGTASSTVGP